MAPTAPSILEDDQPDEDEQHPVESESTSSIPKQVQSKAAPRQRTQKQSSEVEDALLAGIEERGRKQMALQQQLLDQLKPRGDVERDAFIDWVRSVVHELDYDLWRRCQQEISTTVYKYIGENDYLKKMRTPATSTQTTSFQFRQPTHHLQESSHGLSAAWQPPPSQWPIQPTSNTSLWQSQDSNWATQQQQQTLTQLQPMMPPSAASAGSMTAWDALRSSTSISPIQPADLSLGSQTSFRLSDIMKNLNDPQPESHEQTRKE